MTLLPPSLVYEVGRHFYTQDIVSRFLRNFCMRQTTRLHIPEGFGL